ncbi:hypothetical protein MHBO_000155 [Bonamia ostreae]|uniref:Protein yippee-like n=1 Tax=Bonamia ostreae TaxID=126728 RepID=A0ABV2AEK3_9EUKA
MGILKINYLFDDKVYICAKCGIHITSKKYLFSTKFKGRFGPAFLFNRVFNVDLGPEEKRTFLSGDHIVKDVFCLNCGLIVGWFYTKAFENSQFYKLGKCCIERNLVVKKRKNYF